LGLRSQLAPTALVKFLHLLSVYILRAPESERGRYKDTRPITCHSYSLPCCCSGAPTKYWVLRVELQAHGSSPVRRENNYCTYLSPFLPMIDAPRNPNTQPCLQPRHPSTTHRRTDGAQNIFALGNRTRGGKSGEMSGPKRACHYGFGEERGVPMTPLSRAVPCPWNF